MSVLVITDPSCAEHHPGQGHPERPARLDAALAGVELAAASVPLISAPPIVAEARHLTRVHHDSVLAVVDGLASSGGRIDADTAMSPGSRSAALSAAGAGLAAVDRIRGGEADAAFCVVRPPGHHATAAASMGFCLFNNLAVTAAALIDGGDRVAIVDIDVHHGNGTEDIFWTDPRALFVSLHQSPLYPGSGQVADVGAGNGYGATMNIPLRAGSGGAAYRHVFDRVVEPALERFAPDWVLVSAGFDAHRDDPLASMELTAGDFAELGLRLRTLAPPGRLVAWLEGGYDLAALTGSVAAFLCGVSGDPTSTEPVSEGEIDRALVASLVDRHDLA